MPRQDLSTLRKRVSKVSEKPGVYRWKDADGTVLYVGKAKSLKKRMQSYVRPEAKHSAWTEMMVRQIADFDTTITSSELESLILETNLIKKLRPKYNILMKDDKNYVYVRITVNERYPRVELVRGLPENHGARTFGPFLGARFTERTLEMLDSILRFKACKQSLDALNRGSQAGTRLRSGASDGQVPALGVKGLGAPCLDYQIGRCNGLCIGAVTEGEYRERIEEIVRFFRGNFGSMKKRAEEQMKQAAVNRKFEKAAKIRDVLCFIEDLEAKQVVSDTSGENADIFGIALRKGKAQVALLRERDGKVIEHIDFALQGTAETVSEVLGQFLPQYYAQTRDIPSLILLPDAISEPAVLEEWLREKHGKVVRISIPERGKKSKLLEMAERNAEEKVEQQFAAWEAETNRVEGALGELGTLLGLPEPPRRIEGYDISHLGGSATVGSMVVFLNGKAKREHYRSFNIRSVAEGAVDDYKSLAEVLKRRLKYLTRDHKAEQKAWKERGISFGKVRKDERAKILAAIRVQTFSEIEVDYRECVIARKEDHVVAIGYLHRHQSGHLELFCVWVDADTRGNKLGQIISQMLLKRVKKKKVYLGAKPSLEEYYAEIGFRHVVDPSDVLIEEINRKVPAFASDIIMVYDGKEHKTDLSFTDRPDLLLIDGGKGHLSAVCDVLKAMNTSIPSAGLAKREEEIFLPRQSDPTPVLDGSQARFLLQRVRDEAHRFANSLREKRLDARLTASKLDEVPGIGDATKRELMKKFGSADMVIAASDEELESLLNRTQLEQLRKVFPRSFP